MTTQLKTQKILIVEDEKAIREIYVMILSSQGYKVTCASNGLVALEKISQETPDLILMDLMMPEVDGIEAIKRLRSNKLTSEIPIIILTNIGQSEVPDHIVDRNIVDILVKVELSPDELLEKVQTSLSSQL